MSPFMLCSGGFWRDTEQGGSRTVMSSQLAGALEAAPEKAGWGLHNRFGEWSADALRHTYASYHAKWFRDFSLLQLEMGHRSSSLLRERYLNMEGVSRDRARLFWEAPEHGWNNKTGIAGTDFL